MPADATGLVRRGHLRVDFAKGADKLSRHLLVDPSTYLLELVRVAILSGATRVAIEYDANDVVVELDGASFEYAEVEDLFARMVSESFDRRLYLLAVAVGAALAVSDGTVTIFGRQRDGTTHATTYDNDAPGRATPGGKLPMRRHDFRGTLVHVRCSFGLEVAKAALIHAEPREVKLVRQRAARAPIPIMIHGERARALDPLLRVEVGSASGLDVAIELVPVRKSPPTLLFSELGIPVVESTWCPEPWMARPTGTVPIVVRADGPALPLNASQSQVQEDVVSATRELAAYGLPKLADAIRERLDRGNLDAETEDAIGVLAACCRDKPRSCFSFLVDRPLLRDGIGRGVSLRDVSNEEHFRYFLQSDRPLPPDHEHVARDVLWLRGQAIEAHVLAGRLPIDAVRGRIKKGVERRKHVLKTPVEPPRVLSGRGAIATRKIESSNRMRGELVLRDPSTRDPAAWSTLRVYLEGHPIKTATFGENDVWLPYDAAIAWDEHFEPTLAYDDIRRSPATLEVSRLLVEEAGHALLEAFQAATSELSSGLRALALRALQRAPESPALRALPVFPTLDGRFVTLEAIIAIAKCEGAICDGGQDAPPNARAPDGRDVFCLAGSAASIVASAIAPVRILQYEAFLRPAAFSIEAAFAKVCERVGASPAVVVSHTGARGRTIVGLAAHTVVARFHAGYLVEWLALERGPGMVMVTDEPTAFPDVEKQSATPRIDDWIAEMRVRLVVAAVEAAIDSCCTDPGARIEGAVDLTSLAPCLYEVIEDDTLGKSSHPVLCRAPLFRMLDRAGYVISVSVAEIIDAHPGYRPIPFLPAAPPFRVTDWCVVIADGPAIAALTKLSNRLFFKATIELRHRERAAATSARRDDIIHQEPFAGPPPELHPLSPIVDLCGEGFTLRAGLRQSANDERTRVTILYAGRELSRADFDSNVAAMSVVADYPETEALNDVATLVEPRRSSLERALEAVIPLLAREIVASGTSVLLDDLGILRFLAKAAPMATGLLESATMFAPTVTGARVPLRDLLARSKGKRVRFGRCLEVPWPAAAAPTSLDQPMLLAPAGKLGDALLALLRAAGFVIDDMTGVMAEEAAKRRGEPPPAPKPPPSIAASLPVPTHAPPPSRPDPIPLFVPPAPLPEAPHVPVDPVANAFLALLKSTGRFESPLRPTLLYTRARRAVRYRASIDGGSVELGKGAKSIETLLARRDAITLATAALSEVNRECDEVTDQDEVNALLAFLKSL